MIYNTIHRKLKIEQQTFVKNRMQDSNSEYTIDEAHNQNTKPPPV
jgi:hypothetical protein